MHEEQKLKAVTGYVTEEVVRVLKNDAKKRHGMFFGKYIGKILTEKASRIKEKKDDTESI